MPGNHNGGKQESSSPPDSMEFKQRSLFIVLAINMTWQLAIAVLLPLLGGYYLDQRLGTEPWLLIAGSVLAALGVVGVLVNIVRLANRQTNNSNHG